MSNSETPTDRITLRVTAEPETEIFVVDSDFHRVAKGISYLNEQLPPGLYDVKFKAGSAVDHVRVALEPGSGPVDVNTPPMFIQTSAPLWRTAASHETQADNAATLSRQVHENRGDGSQLFVFARDTATDSPNPMSGLTLTTATGDTIVDLASKGQRVGYQRFPSAGYNVSINPGTYRLRVNAANGTVVEHTVVACPGWQTQVFYTVRDCVPGDSGLYPDLTDAAVFMSRLGNGFEPGSDDFRYADLAWQALASQRDVVSRRDLWEMLWGKHRNPMLGIYGGHLLTLAAKPDLATLEEVVRNLIDLVGDHPDVRALTVYLAQQNGQPVPDVRYGLPPMLRSSWEIIVRASSEAPWLVPRRSFSARISDSLWGEGPWLIWLAPAETPEPAAVTDFAAPQPAGAEPTSVDDLTAVMKGLGGPDQVRIALDAPDLTGLERDLANLVYRATVSRPAMTQQAGAKTPSTPTDIPSAMVRSLGVPSSVVTETLAQLTSKLKRRTGTS